MNIFDPIMAMFKIDYEKRLSNMLELDLYEARKHYIKAIQHKQNADTELVYAETRVRTLTELLAKQKEIENGKTSLSNTIAVASTYAASGGQRV